MEKNIPSNFFNQSKFTDTYLANIWNDFLKLTEKENGKIIVDTWFKSLNLCLWDNNLKTIILIAPNNFVKEWIEKNHMDILQKTMSRVLSEKSIIIKILINENIKKSNENVLPAKKINNNSDLNILEKTEDILTNIKINQTTLNKNLTFENLIFGPENETTYYAAKNFINNIGVTCNSLFIQGSSGMGKTHLINAMAIDLKNKKTPFIYQSSDRFIKEYINAVRTNNIDKFEKIFELVDFLFIDDIQTIAKKTHTQEIFLKIINKLINKQKKIILTSDFHPRNISGLSEKLLSRLEGGLILDLTFPSIDTIIKIVEKKAKFHNLKIDNETIEYVSIYISHSIREIDGILIKLATYFSINERSIDLKAVKEILPLAKSSNKLLSITPSVNRLINFISSQLKVNPFDIKLKNKNKKVILAKYLIIYLLKDHFKYSYNHISKIFNYKDHTTVIYAIKKIEELRKIKKEIDIVLSNANKFINEKFD